MRGLAKKKKRRKGRKAALNHKGSRFRLARSLRQKLKKKYLPFKMSLTLMMNLPRKMMTLI